MWLSLLVFAACSPDEPAPTPAAEVSLPDEPAAAPAAPALRRLTAAQYASAVTGLLGPTGADTVRLEPDIEEAGFASVGASVAVVSALGVERYEAAAGILADRAVAAGVEPLLVCVPSGASDRTCADESIAALGRLAYRRPLEPVEVQGLGALWAAVASADGVDQGWRDVLSVLLQSPHFLYRVELGGPDGRLTDHEWLTRTSFLLWGVPPVAALLDRADAGDLSTPDGRRVLVDEMLDDARVADGVQAFVMEWWHLEGLKALDKDPLVFSHAHPELGPAALEETLTVVADLALGDTDFRDLLLTRESWVDPRLAALYGIAAPNVEGFGPATLPADRVGVLGHASFLALHAPATRTSATDRGLFVRSVMLCQSVPDPPANVDTSIPEADTSSPTLRDRLKTHLESPACAGCHALTDPIGFAYETFDGIGRVRTTENGARIDPSGDLDGVAFDDAAGLAHALHDAPDLVPCWTQSLWHYASGRIDLPIPTTDWLGEVWPAQGHALRPLLRELVLSEAFATVEAP